MKNWKDRVAFHVCWVCAVLLIFFGGMAIGRYDVFPAQSLTVVEAGCRRFTELWTGKNAKVFWKARSAEPKQVHCNTDKAWPGLNLVTHVTGGDQLAVKVMDMDGRTLHQWNLDWFAIWPDAKHLPKDMAPQARPGTEVHGAALLPNGNLIFNFEYLGLVCVNLEGKTLWRLPYRTHHTVTLADDGNLWVCGQKDYDAPTEKFANVKVPFQEDTLLEVSPGGKILHEWSIYDLLKKNGREGLFYVGSRLSRVPEVEGDVFHLNDVEPFSPRRMKEGFFRRGDVLVSLRNVSTVFVFNRDDDKIKFIHTGSFIRQHDPDFVDGETISVFDNHVAQLDSTRPQSRILLISARDHSVKTYYEGSSEHSFFTVIMGKHQWLPNGNLLITESCRGRIFEIDRDGKIVWEHNNFEDGYFYLVEEAERLPMETYAALFDGSKSPRKDKQLVNEPKASAAVLSSDGKRPNTSGNTPVKDEKTLSQKYTSS